MNVQKCYALAKAVTFTLPVQILQFRTTIECLKKIVSS